MPRGDATVASRTSLIVLAILMLGDLVFIGLHIVYMQTSLLPSSRWSIEQDLGFPEMFQYGKFIGICLALSHLFLKTHWRVLLGWIAVFALLLFDDAGQIHERFGFTLATRLQLRDFGPVRGSDIGELIYLLLIGLLVVGILAFGWLRGGQLARAISADLAVLLVALGACGVGGDLLHQVLSATFMNEITGVLEDGGEMLVLSLTCAYVMQWTTADVQHRSQVRFQPAGLFGL